MRPSTSPRTGRPGPVVIDIPVTAELGEFDYKQPRRLDLPGYRPTMHGHIKQIRAAAKALTESPSGRCSTSAAASSRRRRPTSCSSWPPAAGPGHDDAHGPGRLSRAHPLSLGMLGMHGTAYANYAVHEMRPAHRRGRALRRPRHRQALGVRAARDQDHPHRHRPSRDRQERGAPHPDRGRRQARPAPASSPSSSISTCSRASRPTGSSASRSGSASSSAEVRAQGTAR